VRLLVGKKMSSEYRRVHSQLRSLDLTRNLQRRLDVQARQIVADLSERFSFTGSYESHLITPGAWEHIHGLSLSPTRVFCHPGMLVEEPFVSLYYRGISGLSLKEVANQARAVVNWERNPETRQRKLRVTDEAGQQVAGLYNSVISSIIENTTDWTLENGFRNIIASLGISFDGSMRNTAGRLPEQRVRRLLLEMAFENGILLVPEYPDKDSLPMAPPNGSYTLTNGFMMTFSSEPDVAFRHGTSLEATIETKGGIDPAGALERLGAAEKSAQSAIEVNRRCKNFLIAGVITAEMRRRLNQGRFFEKDFLLVELLSNETRQNEFFDEIFNHTLRIAPPTLPGQH
jgi:hypothetical protein